MDSDLPSANGTTCVGKHVGLCYVYVYIDTLSDVVSVFFFEWDTVNFPNAHITMVIELIPQRCSSCKCLSES
uniref:Uncharacterized protein n=1 Tax=Pararge aegeria TaxID=116150 RepID=S4NZR6_9NEOP